MAATGSQSQAVRPIVCDQTGIAGGVQGNGATQLGQAPGTPQAAFTAAQALAAGTGNGVVQNGAPTQGQAGVNGQNGQQTGAPTQGQAGVNGQNGQQTPTQGQAGVNGQQTPAQGQAGANGQQTPAQGQTGAAGVAGMSSSSPMNTLDLVLTYIFRCRYPRSGTGRDRRWCCSRYCRYVLIYTYIPVHQILTILSGAGAATAAGAASAASSAPAAKGKGKAAGALAGLLGKAKGN